MFKLATGCAGLLLLVLPTLAAAAPGEQTQQQSIPTMLNRAVGAGLTIDEAVKAAVTADRQHGEAITMTALQLLHSLPRTACATRAHDGGVRLAVWPDFRACADRVVQAAIAAGVDPTRLLQASAAGSTDDKAGEANPGIDLYLRRLFLVGGS